MKRRRIFIAINLPESVKKKLLEFQKEWADLPVNWTKRSNLHITLVFIGYLDDEEVLEICQLARQISQKYQSFEIELKRICLGPPHGPARMIWLEGKVSPVLTQLKNDLENVLLNSAKNGYSHGEKRSFQPHITLARIRQGEWRDLLVKPKIEKEISLIFPVASIEIMESHLSRKGPDYAALESVELSGLEK